MRCVNMLKTGGVTLVVAAPVVDPPDCECHASAIDGVKQSQTHARPDTRTTRINTTESLNPARSRTKASWL